MSDDAWRQEEAQGADALPATDATRAASDRWQAAEALFQQALERAPDERRAFLSESGADASLRAEVEALLAAHDSHGVLDALVDDVMSPLLAPGRRAETAPPPSGNDRYRILDRLGGGGMGVVYRARDDRLERDVALKFLPPHLSADPAAKKRFLVEARAAAALEHPNICTVHEIGETNDGQLYIVMACYDGESLDRRIARAPLPVDEALRVAGEVARGLAKAHERGIVHRDIKPANVAVTSDGLVKILDFGIAKLAGVNITRGGGAIGTLAYMSPEQAFAEAVDHRTDLWSLGVVLYEMLAGVRPFRGPGEQAMLVAALTADPEPLTTIRPDVPPEVDAVIRRALAKKPEDRYAGALEMAAAIAACPVRPPNVAPVAASASAGPDVEPRDTALTRGGERRQVTVIASALAGHELLLERLSPEESDRWLARVRDTATEVATQHGGIVNQFAGEGFIMLFGVPTAREDDAVRGVRAVLALHARVTDLAATLDPRLAGALRLRSGVHVGPVVAQRLREGDRRFRIAGPPADIATRLSGAAEPNAILLSPETRRLVAPFVRTEEGRPVALQSDGAPVVPHRLLGASDARSRLEGATRAALTPFAGRERERATLAEHLASARDGMGRFTVLIGEAGVGKSRLLHELRDAADHAGVRALVGRCDAYGGTTPFLPFVEAAQDALALPRGGDDSVRHDALLRAARSIDASLDDFVPLYLALLGIPTETHPVPEHLRGELFQAAMLEAIAALFTLGSRTQPTVLFLEDWHWADEPSRAALRQLAEIVPNFPLLLVTTSRPDGQADWGSADHQVLLHLSPLDRVASAAIARDVFGADRIAPELVTRLHERTGGNPFFLEEVCEALREEGVITLRDGEATVADAAGTVHVPETVQGVLRTRIDRLDGEARDALRVASVIGREFARGVLDDVLEQRGDLSRALERLKGSGLVQQISVVPEPVYRFKHALTEEVAYDSLLEHQRAMLHAAVGRAIETRYAAHLDKHIDRLSHHFSRAEAWGEAVRYAMQSADRAAALSQNTDALATLERAEQWVQRMSDDVASRDLRADVLLQQERMCETLGLRTRQLAIADALIGMLESHGASQRLARAYLRQGDAYTVLERFDEAERSLDTSLRIAETLDDTDGERQALRSAALLRTFQGRHAEALAHIERVIALGKEAGDQRAAAGDLATKANILRALRELPQALETLLYALEHTELAHNAFRYCALLNVIGVVYQEMGDSDTALSYFLRVSEQGLDPKHQVNLVTLPNIAYIYLNKGRVDEALALFRQAVDMNLKARYAFGSAHACRSLGDALVGLARYAEAVAPLRQAIALFAQLEDRTSEVLMWRRLAEAYEALRRPEDARDAWTSARELLRGRDPSCEAEALAGVARAERDLPVDAQSMLAHYREALSLAERAGDARRALGLRNSLGIAHWQRGEYADAVSHYVEALRLCRASGDRVHEGLILNSLGVSLYRLQRLDEAREALSESLAVTEQAGERQLHAHALAALADVAMAQDAYDEARDCIERSLALRKLLGDRRGEGWLLERLARVCVAQGNTHEARVLGAAACSIAVEVDDHALQVAADALRSSETTNDTDAVPANH